MNRETMWQILTEDLVMRNISSKTVPQILTDEQKYASCVPLELFNYAKISDRVITSDKMYFQYNLKTKYQNMQ